MARLPLVLLAGCSTAVPFDPEAGVATDIAIEVHSDGWGNELAVETLASEGALDCGWPEEQPYADPAPYYAYARADGFYTAVLRCTEGETVTVDLDAKGDHADAVAGTVIATQTFFAPALVADWPLRVGGTRLTTDALGRYGAEGLAGDPVDLVVRWEGERFTLAVPNGPGTDDGDFLFLSPLQAAKPNVYLRPEAPTDVSVTLDFPRGGHLDVSDPPYRHGWRVRATPDGRLDGRWTYLFYEATVQPVVQRESGWVVDGRDAEAGFRALLAGAGFVAPEIDDFVAYWIPVLPGARYYAVYPQDADAWVTLDVDPAPDTVLRALWLVHPVPAAPALRKPDLPHPDRAGFVVAEWGVIRGWRTDP